MQIALPSRPLRLVEVLRVLWLMSRPSHLLLIIFVYFVGGAMALAQGAELDSAQLGFGILPLVLVSVSIHYANEYSDFETDSLTTRTPFSGGSGALPSSDLSPELAIVAARISLAIGVLLSVYGLMLNRIELVAVLLLFSGVVLGWMYSLPPLKLAWKGWGELDNALAGGMALPLFGFTVAAGRLNIAVVAACLPFVALVFLNLLATTWPDREADATVGKNTLAVLWPVDRLRELYWGVAVGFLLVIPLLIGWSIPAVVAWTSFLVAPLVIISGIVYTRRQSPLAAVAAMVSMAFVQFMAWLSMLA
jgi:1,4-dihydroxy-2-naphthoate octaprenyltransferase